MFDPMSILDPNGPVDPPFPPQDEHGVDLEQIAYHQTLTPAQRLDLLQEFASFVLEIWKSRGIEWSTSEPS